MSKTNYLVRRSRKNYVNLLFSHSVHVDNLYAVFPDANEKLKGAFERYKQKLAELKTNQL